MEPSTSIALALLIGLSGPLAAAAAPPAGPFAGFDLPDDWEARLWASPNAKTLFGLSPKAVAELVPTQAGVRFCRCPACDADEADDPLGWSVAKPRALTCRRCGVTVPNDKYPAHEEKKPVPEDTVDVLPGVTHHYPYHEPERPRFPGERLYLAAKADHEAREFLAKAALYAAVRYREQAPGRKDPALARTAAVILVRFSQVYPSYATHFDQPSSPKYFQQADLPPPYRHGYGTGKWDWSASLNVPLNLVVAYALLRGDPAIAEAGRLLDEPEPSRAIERDLFRGAAEFVRRQPEEFSEASLQAYRGLLAVGRLLDDPVLVRDALGRLDRFARRGFYYDGFWRQGTLSAHRRVLGQLDGWMDRLLTGYDGPGAADVPMLALARAAGAAPLTDPRVSEVQQAAWPAPSSRASPRAPALLGGAGVARLALGRGDDALDVELRGLGSFGDPRTQRQALRVAVGGRPVLGDLDESPGLRSGFDRASVSHNTVTVDGLNQRESLARAREPAPGGSILFFAADPDFQAVTLDDPWSYPQSATRYRQTVVASAGARSRYALSVFEVHGGLQHDQLFHAPAGSRSRWRLSAPVDPWPGTLLPPGLTFVPTAQAGDGRWFVQAYGELSPTARGRVDGPAQAWADGPNGVRLHLLGDTPMTAVTADGPDPTAPGRRGPGDDSGLAALVLRRRSEDGSTLRTLFVTLFEPVSAAVPPLSRVGRVKSSADAVVIYVETADGPEHLVINLAPGSPRAVTLADGRRLTTDGLAVRASGSGLVLAGGTFAESAGQSVRQRPAAGRITAAVRQPSGESQGWFETDTPLPDPEALAGRALLIKHGDHSSHGWTIHHADRGPSGSRVFVREEPGFEIDRKTGVARYYQFPQATAPGPHHFRISQIAR